MENNAVLENILTRHSCRSFAQQEITKSQLDTLLQAALYAPTARNGQSWQFTALRNKPLMQRLAQAIAAELGRDDGYNFYAPDVLIIPSNSRDNQWGRDDNACALENIFLAAHSLGLGAVWINQMQGISDRPAIRALLDEIGVPAEHVVYGMAAVGVPAGEPKEIKRVGVTRVIG